ncbi:hypothetical protein BCR42DRAFT_426659 [Absidia repens]|uniref:Uncharacterized protein n=1 Tax=Absidia repens TaxID=90262 RepID=A0A1X2I276_9FUNG|nr:hypothetical protein BCR42DRAFT_426659 [Absidia repens]
MHFIFQALHRRPLEPKSLAISRGVSAILLSLVFLAYVGFLIYQIYTDSRLLIITTQNLHSYPSPDVEMCVYGSRWEISSCALITMDYDSQVVPRCTPYLIGSPADNEGPQWCWVFKTDQLEFGVELGNTAEASPSPEQSQIKTIRRVDIYWAISNLTAYNLYNPWAPSVTVTLYSPGFSSWRIKPANMIPQQATAWRNLQLQHYVSSTIMNYWNTIYFTPARYRAIRPYDPLSILGINSSFIDIDTLHTSQHDWPLNNASINYTKYGEYQGVLSFLLSAGDMEVRTEQRNHTLLAALALAGGCYGVIFAIYCVLYGTPKLAPFGLTHGMSIWYYRGKSKLGRKKTDVDEEDHSSPTNLHVHRSSKNHLLSMDGTSIHSNSSLDSHEQLTTNDNHHSLESIHPAMIRMDTINRTAVSNGAGKNQLVDESNSVPSTAAPASAPAIQSPSTASSSHYFTHLESRVQELESILREYFLDVDYLDALRTRQREYIEAGAAATITENRRQSFALPYGTHTRKSITGQEWT